MVWVNFRIILLILVIDCLTDLLFGGVTSGTKQNSLHVCWI